MLLDENVTDKEEINKTVCVLVHIDFLRRWFSLAMYSCS